MNGELSDYFPESCLVSKLEIGATGILCGYSYINNKAKLFILRCYLKEPCIMEINTDLPLAKDIYRLMKDKKVRIRKDKMLELI